MRRQWKKREHRLFLLHTLLPPAFRRIRARRALPTTTYRRTFPWWFPDGSYLIIPAPTYGALPPWFPFGLQFV